MSLKHIAIAGLIAAAAMTAVPANATTILFSGSSGGSSALDVSFSGIFDGVWNGSAYVLDAVSGTQTQGANSWVITALSGYAGADNLLFGPDNDLLPDFGGISWSTSGGTDFNWFTSGGDFELASTTDPVGYPQNGVALNGSSFGVVLDRVAGVPEPATWAMFLLGFGAIGFALRGSRGKQAVAATA